MSNLLVAVLFCLGLLAVCWAVENPSVSAQPDDKGKDKKPAFRAGAVRYQVKDVGRSVTFYAKHLGFKVEKQFGAGTPFAKEETKRQATSAWDISFDWVTTVVAYAIGRSALRR